jgi:hypothetical protein
MLWHGQDLFEDLIERDEYQLEGMQVYSHILYIREEFAQLSHLAHRAVFIDKYRHETCCIIGNYYSLKQQHHKVRRYRSSLLNHHVGCCSVAAVDDHRKCANGWTWNIEGSYFEGSFDVQRALCRRYRISSVL